MSHDSHTASNRILELDGGLTADDYRKMARGWKDPFPLPRLQIFNMEQRSGRKVQINVVRDDLAEIGSKGRFGSLLVQRMQEDTIVYVAPRVGWAPISLAKLCKMYDKRLILFAPASREASIHQQTAVELGAEMRFHRIAAMPVLQSKAREFAEKHGYLFAPLGLRHPLVTAAIVATADKLAKKHGEPDEFWTATSTGVLNRGLQLGWPNARAIEVAVSRNIKDGEKGRATIVSHPQPFLQDAPDDQQPPFPSARNYDAKVWRAMQGHISQVTAASEGAWFWNVAGEIAPSKPIKLKSDVPWGDGSAFRRK